MGEKPKPELKRTLKVSRKHTESNGKKERDTSINAKAGPLLSTFGVNMTAGLYVIYVLLQHQITSHYFSLWQ